MWTLAAARQKQTPGKDPQQQQQKSNEENEYDRCPDNPSSWRRFALSAPSHRQLLPLCKRSSCTAPACACLPPRMGTRAAVELVSPGCTRATSTNSRERAAAPRVIIVIEAAKRRVSPHALPLIQQGYPASQHHPRNLRALSSPEAREPKLMTIFHTSFTQPLRGARGSDAWEGVQRGLSYT